MQPAPMNVGLRKRLSFSAVRITQKPSLDMLACVSKQLPYRYHRGNSTQRCHLDEMGHSIFYPHPPPMEGIFLNVKNDPVGIWIFCSSLGGRNRESLFYTKTGLSESSFRVKGACQNLTSEVKGTCRRNAFHRDGGGGCG